MPERKIIAILISLFVLPGMGHVYLGKKKKGYVLAVLICLILLFLAVFFEWNLVWQAQMASDPTQIFTSIFAYAKKTWMQDHLIYWSGLSLTGLIWIYSAIDISIKKPDR